MSLARWRLSTIDLSPAGHQPIMDATGTGFIVFNGEIYDFTDLWAELVAEGEVFCSQSDA